MSRSCNLQLSSATQTKLSEGCHFIFILLQFLIKLLCCYCGHISIILSFFSPEKVAINENRIKNWNKLARQCVLIWYVQWLGVWGTSPVFLFSFCLPFSFACVHNTFSHSSSDTSPFSLFSPHYLSSSVWYYKWRGSQRGFDGAQPARCPAALPDERRGPAGVCWSAGHAGWRSLLQPGRGHCSGHGHPLPCHVHQHRLVEEEKGTKQWLIFTHLTYIG